MAETQISGKVLPEVLHNYNIYNIDGNKQLGTGESITLAAVQFITATISGAGILGQLVIPIVGQTQDISQEVPYRVLYGGVSDYIANRQMVGFVLRGAYQVLDRESNQRKPMAVKVDIRGACTNVNPGTAQNGNAMNGSITVSASYYKMEVADKVIFELDKINGIFIVNGIDILKEYRDMC